jgi:hypothetical protein
MSSVVLAFVGFFPVRRGCGRRKYVFAVQEMMWYTLSIICCSCNLFICRKIYNPFKMFSEESSLRNQAYFCPINLLLFY